MLSSLWKSASSTSTATAADNISTGISNKLSNSHGSSSGSSGNGDSIHNGNSSNKGKGSLPAGSSSSMYSSSIKNSQFDELLNQSDVNVDKLRKISWTGIPAERRATVWKILFGYLPTQQSRREAVLQRKRQEYLNSIPKFYGSSASATSTTNGEAKTSHAETMVIAKPPTDLLLEEDQKNLRQIIVDIPRTAPDLPLFHSDEVRKSIERVLYVWSVRHPASGYVQGMNDIVTPLYASFLADFITKGNVKETNKVDVSSIDKDVLDAVEADCFWCFTKLLDGIQDHYTCSQPGVQRNIYQLQAVIQRIDSKLYEHLENHGLMFYQFAFRWMNCLLLRELPLHVVVRLWDTYLAEDVGDFFICLLLSFLD